MGTLVSKQQIFARIVGALGGRAAEVVVFGEDEVTTGASGDLQQVSNMAKPHIKTIDGVNPGGWLDGAQGSSEWDEDLQAIDDVTGDYVHDPFIDDVTGDYVAPPDDSD